MSLYDQSQGYNKIFVPNVVIIDQDPVPVAAAGEIDTIGYVGEFPKGPANQDVYIDDWDDFFQTFIGVNHTGMFDGKGFLDMYMAYVHAKPQMVIRRVLGGTGSPVESTLTVQDLPYATLTVKEATDTNDIITFTSRTAGTAGNQITVTISAGVGATKTFTIARGDTIETHENLDMDETVPGTYIVDYINSNSTLVSVTRESLDSNDDLPKDLSATALSGGTPEDIITFTAASAGSDGNNIRVTIQEGSTSDLRTITIVDGNGVQDTETYQDLNMDETVPASYIVDVINGASNLVVVTRDSGDTTDSLPKAITSQPLTGGSDGAATAATITLIDDEDDNILKLDYKYVGTTGNYCYAKVETGTVANTFKLTLTEGIYSETFDNLTMGTTDTRYAVDVINNESTGSMFVTASKLGANDDLPKNIDNTALTGGSNGDPANDSEVQTEIDELVLNPDVDFITVGSYGPGTANAVALAIESACATSGLITGIVSTSQGSDTESDALALAAAIQDEDVWVTYNWGKILNPVNNTYSYVSPATAIAAVSASIKPNLSPARKPLYRFLEFNEKVSGTGNINKLARLTNGGVIAVGDVAPIGKAILNGITSSQEIARKHCTRGRMVKYIARSLDAALQSIVGKPHTLELRREFITICSNVLSRMVDEKMIGNPNTNIPFKVRCDDRLNTTQTMREGKLIGEVEVSLFGIADTVIVRLTAQEALEIEIVR